MHRKKGTLNTPQTIIDEIVVRHRAGIMIRELAEDCNKSYKTIKSMIYRENCKERQKEFGLPPRKARGRKPAVSLQDYKYENKRLKMENELLLDFLYLAGRK
ncbi:imidazolonepropionase [Hydrogenoanaerobacterium sp.]|uniref:imidazolonepropionase n=1 Tax=Hydrogenoanaerobacterium sp. TaxID=2953763 RepID=UPI0028998C52|nr:imidazolonepropionase [Hydrogenoanaerobacterium sp.]